MCVYNMIHVMQCVDEENHNCLGKLFHVQTDLASMSALAA